MSNLHKAVSDYAREVSTLAMSDSSNEGTYYPALRNLIAAVLADRGLPFQVRTVTSEQRVAGGVDQPDLALYDGEGDFVALLGEVKLPKVEIDEMQSSVDRNDQIGRYLARTRVVLLCNVRGFGLLTVKPGFNGAGAVPVAFRRLEDHVDLWPSLPALRRGEIPEDDKVQRLAELIETAITRYAPISEPQSLARILARQAKRAKSTLPEKFGAAVAPLRDDFGKALGITFEGEEGEEFFRSSLIQTAFYGLFAGWALWVQSGRNKPFEWERLSDYLCIPFLGKLFYEFRHPDRIKDLKLKSHLDMATETLGRVDVDLFFTRFKPPALHEGTTTPATTAITYFYEPFLEAFDPDLRKQLGVWYTPWEIVRYQVQKVDRILREELHCERGFADESVVVLDPCCGTGAYLIEVLRCIFRQLESEGAGDELGAKLLRALCKRVIGFEILTAPFVVAQLQLYLMLVEEFHVTPDEDRRPAVYLTNALTGWSGPEQLKLNFPELQQEHDAARKVKTEAKIIVVLGNPPYNRWAGVPLREEADLVDHYKGIRRDKNGRQIGKSELFTRWRVRKHLLDDLYVRFYRLAEQRIGQKAESGVVSYISNYSYLTGRSHPIMRESILASFHSAWIDSLNGDKYKTGKTIPKGQPGEGSSDQSVFSTDQDARGIQVGAAITTLLKRKNGAGPASVFFRDFWGRAAKKRQALLSSLDMARWSKKKRDEAAGLPEGPRRYAEFTPTEKTRWKLIPYAVEGGFEDWPSIGELFPWNFMGVHTGKDSGVIAFSEGELKARFADYLNPDISDATIAERTPALMKEANEFNDPAAFRRALLADDVANAPDEKIKKYLYRPLDERAIWYETTRREFVEDKGREKKRWSGCLIQRYGEEFEKAIEVPRNAYLCAVSEPRRRSETRPLVTRGLVDLHVSDRGITCFPARRPAEPEDKQTRIEVAAPRRREITANLADGMWAVLKKDWNIAGDLASAGAENLVNRLFSATLAICHSPQYELDHEESLAQDWAHIPIPKQKRTMNALADLGDKVCALLDPAASARKTIDDILGDDARRLGVATKVGGGGISGDDTVISYSYYMSGLGKWVARPPGGAEVLRAEWGTSTGDLFLNEKVFLRNVPENVWRYELGGYPIIKKWFGYRDGGRRPRLPLSLDELDHLRSMIQRIAALLALRPELDKRYEQAVADAYTAEELGLR